MTSRIIVGDCRTIMPTLEPASVDAIVTDPPYELGFMGKAWDSTGVNFDPATWEAAKRVLKPGGYLLAFCGTRTFHRMTVAIEDAGFEIKDCLAWLYGTGWPKHKSALKPAWEPIVVAKKAGRGGLQTESCRIGETKDVPASPSNTHSIYHKFGNEEFPGWQETSGFNPNIGRWPANVILDEEAAAGLDASRFFYVAKASRAERDCGLENRGNDHTTVKPVDLMAWLVRLATPPGGTVLDPFTGSGSTGIAAEREGFDFIGIEEHPHNAELARRRIAGDAPMFNVVAPA